jgi:hypothetical protein
MPCALVMPVNETAREQARIWSDKVLARLERLPNYTGLSAPDRYYFGYIGEIAFRDLLWLRGCKWFYQARLDGRADSEDFVVWPRYLGRTWSVNVKNASKVYHRKVMMPEKQWQKHKHNIYVGTRMLAPDLISIEGYAPWKEFSENSVVEQVDVETRSCLFSKLFDMEMLLAGLERE